MHKNYKIALFSMVLFNIDFNKTIAGNVNNPQNMLNITYLL